MAEKLPKKYRKALRGDLDVKSRKAPRNPDLPKWDYKAGGYTRSVKEQSAYMKEKSQKKADNKFKEEAGFGDYALELGGYASAAYLYFKLPKLRDIGKSALWRSIGVRGPSKKPRKLFNYKGSATQRIWHIANIKSKSGSGKVANLKGLKLLRQREGDSARGYQLRSLLTGPEADKLEKDLLKRTPNATEKIFLQGKKKMREIQQKGQIITKKEFKSKGKVKLLKKQNWGTGNISKGNVVDSSISNLNEKLRNVSLKKGRLSEPTGGNLNQFQTKSKKQLLSNQSVKSKGGGKSGGGGGGKWGGMFKGRGGSPWNLLKNDKSF